MRLITRKPGSALAAALAALPCAARLVADMVGSEIRLAAKPSDRLLSARSTIGETAKRVFTTPDRRSGKVLLWHDTWASLVRRSRRHPGGAREHLRPAHRPPAVHALHLRALPRGDLDDPAARSSADPVHRLRSRRAAQGGADRDRLPALPDPRSLGPFAGNPPREDRQDRDARRRFPHVAPRVALPQMMPRPIGATRLSLGPAWLFLIAAGAFVADQGRGYRTFLVGLSLAMDVILTHVAWTTCLAFVTDVLLRRTAARAFPWAEAGL